MKISLVGDLCLTTHQTETPPDYRSLFDTEIVVANLEGPVSTDAEPIQKLGPSLAMPSSAFDHIAAAGISIVSLANNHIFDSGRRGLGATIEILDRRGIRHFGAGLTRAAAAEPITVTDEHGGIALIGFAEKEWNTDGESGANIFEPVAAYRSVARASRQYRHVIVTVHGGNEHVSLPSPSFLDQLAFLTEAGAAAVVVHHSHRVSGLVQREGKPIFAGLGNFFFPMLGMARCWTLGLVAHLEVNGDQLCPTYDFVRFGDRTWPRLVEARETSHEQRRLERLSAAMDDPRRHEETWRSEIQPFAESYLAWLATSPGSGKASQLIRQAQARYVLRRMPTMLRQWRSLLVTPAHQSAAIASVESALANLKVRR